MVDRHPIVQDLGGLYGIRVRPAGFIVHPRPFQRNSKTMVKEMFRTGVDVNDPLYTDDPNALTFRWREDFRVSAVDPWPRVRIERGGVTTELAPRTALGLRSPLGFARQVRQDVEKIRDVVPDKVDLGWMAHPVVEWEPVSVLPPLPEEVAASKRGGAYRAGGPSAEVAVAARGAPSSLELMLDWLASTPERTWRAHPRQVRLSEDDIFIERRGGARFRLPLSTLRHREGPVDDDAVYVFGRRTRLVLPHRREGCAVREHLDRRLAGASEA